MGVGITDFFNHIESFMEYRSTVYEISDQTIKSNRCDLKLFENFMDENQHQTITGPAVMDFQNHLKTQRKNCGGSLNRFLKILGVAIKINLCHCFLLNGVFLVFLLQAPSNCT